jgi:hypothetical protein
MTQLTTKKQLIKDFHKAQDGFISSMKKGLEYAVLMGDALTKIKDITPHGQFESVLKNDIDVAFGVRHAQRFMAIAANKELIQVASVGELLSINEMTKLISDATPEQIEKAEQLRREEEARRQQVEAEKQRKAAELQAKKAAQEKPKEPEIIEGEFKEIKPSQKKEEPARPKEDPIDVMSQVVDELQAANSELIQEIESVTRVLESNDQTGKALDEAKRFREVNRVLEERIRGLQNEANEAKRQAKYWKGKFEKLAKEVGHVEC